MKGLGVFLSCLALYFCLFLPSSGIVLRIRSVYGAMPPSNVGGSLETCSEISRSLQNVHCQGLLTVEAPSLTLSQPNVLGPSGLQRNIRGDVADFILLPGSQEVLRHGQTH